MRRTIYIGLVILAAAMVFSACYRSGSSSSNGDTDKDTESDDLGTSTSSSGTYNPEEMNTSSSEDTDVGTDSESDTGADSESDTGSDSESDTGSDLESDTGSDSESDTGSDSESDTGSDSNSDIGTDTGTTPGSDTGSDACAAMKASHDGTECGAFLGVSWDGKLCRSIYCGCTGDDCDQLYISQEECVAARATCMEPCPYSDYPVVLTEEDDGCLCGNEQYYHCCPDGMDFCRCSEGTSRYEDPYEDHLVCGEH